MIWWYEQDGEGGVFVVGWLSQILKMYKIVS